MDGSRLHDDLVKLLVRGNPDFFFFAKPEFLVYCVCCQCIRPAVYIGHIRGVEMLGGKVRAAHLVYTDLHRFIF